MITLLTGEAVEMVDVALGPHDHLKGGNGLGARGTEPSSAK